VCLGSGEACGRRDDPGGTVRRHRRRASREPATVLPWSAAGDAAAISIFTRRWPNVFAAPSRPYRSLNLGQRVRTGRPDAPCPRLGVGEHRRMSTGQLCTAHLSKNYSSPSTRNLILPPRRPIFLDRAYLSFQPRPLNQCRTGCAPLAARRTTAAAEANGPLLTVLDNTALDDMFPRGLPHTRWPQHCVRAGRPSAIPSQRARDEYSTPQVVPRSPGNSRPPTSNPLRRASAVSGHKARAIAGNLSYGAPGPQPFNTSSSQPSSSPRSAGPHGCRPRRRNITCTRADAVQQSRKFRLQQEIMHSMLSVLAYGSGGRREPGR